MSCTGLICRGLDTVGLERAVKSHFLSCPPAKGCHLVWAARCFELSVIQVHHDPLDETNSLGLVHLLVGDDVAILSSVDFDDPQLRYHESVHILTVNGYPVVGSDDGVVESVTHLCFFLRTLVLRCRGPRPVLGVSAAATPVRPCTGIWRRGETRSWSGPPLSAPDWPSQVAPKR